MYAYANVYVNYVNVYVYVWCKWQEDLMSGRTWKWRISPPMHGVHLTGKFEVSNQTKCRGFPVFPIIFRAKWATFLIISGFWGFLKARSGDFQEMLQKAAFKICIFSWWISCEPLVASGNGSVDDLQCLKFFHGRWKKSMAISDWGRVAFSGIVGYISYTYIYNII